MARVRENQSPKAMTTPGVTKTKEITLTRLTEALAVTIMLSPTIHMPKRKTMVALSKPQSVQTFRQSFLPSFPCPIMLTSGDNCSASHTPSVFGTGNCHGCSRYRQFLWKTHVSDSPPPSPYKHALYLGYDRAVIANLEDSSHELMLAIASTTLGSTFHQYSTDQQEWWEIIVHPTPPNKDPLSELPKFTDVITYQLPSKSFFLPSQP